jgi:Domain of unknown function (DUF4276)
MGIKPVLWVEGGVRPQTPNGDPSFAGVTDGTERLQEALYSLFGQKYPNLRVTFVIYPSGGFTQTLTSLYNHCQTHPQAETRALIDSDAGPGEKIANLNSKLAEVSTRIGRETTHLAQLTFLMVQAIEAWFLAQPKAAELVMNKQPAQVRKRMDSTWSSDPGFGQSPEHVAQPDQALDRLVRQNFEYYEDRRQKWRNVRYDKNLVAQAQWLESLDLNLLITQFEDVARLVDWLDQAPSQ